MNDMKLFIDGTQADIDGRTGVSVTLSVARLTEFESSRTGYAKTIVLPMSPRNMELLGDEADPNAAGDFNAQGHTARIEADGCTVLEGVLTVAECVVGRAAGYYRVNIIGPGKEWVAAAAATPLRQLDVPYGVTLTGEAICRSWEDDTPVRFLPVQREGFEPANPDRNVFAPQKILSYEDYHPFLHVRTMVERIFARAGYAISSQFMSGPLFDSLYMSGNYPQKDTALQRSKMDFRAGRTETAQAAADHLGRVYATPYANQNTIGNIVETANPANSDQIVGELFSIGECFRRVDRHVAFVPTGEIVMGFEYTFAYTTQYRITGPRTVVGFDTIYTGGEQAHKFSLTMPFEDRREQMVGFKTFKVVVYDYADGERLRMDYWEITNAEADPDNLQPGDYQNRSTAQFTTAEQNITINTYNRIVNARLMKFAGNSFSPYTGQWGIYDATMTRTGTMDVQVTVRSGPERVTPASPKTFYDIYFGGADPQMTLQIGRATTVRPVFAYGPTEGAQLDFAQVAAHRISCLDLINGLKQMFNLYFITDQAAKTVYVEPRADFYAPEPVVDLSGAVDLAKGLAVSGMGDERYGTLALCYADGDSAVAGAGAGEQGPMGVWSVRIGSGPGVRTYRNPLFAPTVSAAGGYNGARDALLMQVRSTAGVQENDGEQLNFTPRIVRYLGMKELPAGQSWGWPGDGNRYPFAAFHYHGDDNPYSGDSPNPLSTFSPDAATLWQNGLSLCHEDRDGVAGLHRMRDADAEQLLHGRRVEAWVMLRPCDVESFVSLTSLKTDFRALYRLTIDGESALYRLEEIVDYNPQGSTPTKCIFIKEV